MDITDKMQFYKARYEFYKNKCEKLEEIVNRFQEILQKEMSASSPVLSLGAHQKDTSHSSPSEQSPILGNTFKFRKNLFKDPSSDDITIKPSSSESTLVDVESVSEPYDQCHEQCSPTNKVEHDKTNTLQSKESVKDDLSDYDDITIEPGSNKWEFMDMEGDSEPTDQSSENRSSVKRKNTDPETAAIFQRLRELPKFSGLENQRKTEVSKKIKGVERRCLPGWACDKCEEYYAAAGVSSDTINRLSRHRSTHPRVRSPKGFWDLNM